MDSLNNNDIILRITPYLNAHELLNLALTCKRFGGTNDDTKQNSSDDNNNDSHYTWSLMEEAARQIINNAKEEERNALPRYDGETWLALYKELELLRAPLTFDQFLEKTDGLHYVDNDKSRIETARSSLQRSGISNNIMRSGKHYATFRRSGTVQGYMRVGVMRPMKGLDQYVCEIGSKSPLDWESFRRCERWGKSEVHVCHYLDYNGGCFHHDWKYCDGSQSDDWTGMESFENGGYDVGMLLDLDEGTLSVYIDGRRLGIMKSVSFWFDIMLYNCFVTLVFVFQSKGLAGEYCWVAVIGTYDTSPATDACEVQITRGDIPEISRKRIREE